MNKSTFLRYPSYKFAYYFYDKNNFRAEETGADSQLIGEIYKVRFTDPWDQKSSLVDFFSI